jgi:hypothetical protein
VCNITEQMGNVKLEFSGIFKFKVLRIALGLCVLCIIAYSTSCSNSDIFGSMECV